MSYKEKIIELGSKGFSYNQIVKEVGCSKGTVAYHLGHGQKEKTRERAKKHRGKSTLIKKVDFFRNRKAKMSFLNRVNNEFRKNDPTIKFGYLDVLEKIGESPKCYLTGRPIDLNESSTYHLDHIVPRALGGDNSLENLQIATKEANQAKSGLYLSDFLDLCEAVLNNFGYKVEKPE